MPIDINTPLTLKNASPANTTFDVEPPGGGTAVPKGENDSIDWGSTVIAKANASADLQGTPVGGGALLQAVNFSGMSPVTLDPDWNQVTSVDEYYYDDYVSTYVVTVTTDDGSETVNIRG